VDSIRGNPGSPRTRERTRESNTTHAGPVAVWQHVIMGPGSNMSPAAAAEADETVLALGSGAR